MNGPIREGEVFEHAQWCPLVSNKAVYKYVVRHKHCLNPTDAVADHDGELLLDYATVGQFSPCIHHDKINLTCDFATT